MKASTRIRRHSAVITLAICSLAPFAPSAIERGDLRQDPWIAGSMTARPADAESESEKGREWILPLRRTGVKLNITAGIVEAEVTQRFVNNTGQRLEAVYRFPLPSEATVTGMEVRIGDRLIRSVVQRKAEARETYEAAKKEGKAAALLEQERPNLFTMSVANFVPGEVAVTKLTYVQKAEFRTGAYLVHFPMTIGPKFMPEGMSTGEIARVSNVALPPWIESGHRLTLDAQVCGMPVKEIVSSTHQLRTGREDGTVAVSLRHELAIPDKDFAMEIRLEDSTTPELSVVQSTDGKDKYQLVSVFPPEDKPDANAPAMPRDVVFLIDTSGSMKGDSIIQAKSGLTECLKMLAAGDRFTIVRFSSDFTSFRDELVPADESHLARARDYIETLEADGGTQMQPALRHVLGLTSRKEAMKMVIFLTDGAVGDENTLFRLLDQRLADRRLFTFGIGSAPNEHLMRKMGELGHGQARFIRTEENVGRVMSDFFKTVAAPVLTDIRLTWFNAGNEKIEVKTYPKVCPDVFHERPLQVVANSSEGEHPASMEVAGRLAGKDVQYRFEFSGADVAESGAIETLFGRAHIDELRFLMIRSVPAEHEKLAEEIALASLKYQLVSKYTSRVAVEEKLIRNPRGELVSVPVPNEFPGGWDAPAFFGTATNDTLRLALAAALLLFAVGAGLVQRFRFRGPVTA